MHGTVRSSSLHMIDCTDVRVTYAALRRNGMRLASQTGIPCISISHLPVHQQLLSRICGAPPLRLFVNHLKQCEDHISDPSSLVALTSTERRTEYEQNWVPATFIDTT